MKALVITLAKVELKIYPNNDDTKTGKNRHFGHTGTRKDRLMVLCGGLAYASVQDYKITKWNYWNSNRFYMEQVSF
ncbi:MAG: hypothetical protein LBS79_03220 [Tannerella sp.]|jgi:hypothetical protein|nr:hypothetical protein [Tannerella sp.]